MTNLNELGRKWHTAKVLDPHNPLSHDYGPAYDRLLAGHDVKKMLEIGLGPRGLVHQDQVAGCSLFMWAEYFPDADIYGLDIREDVLVNEGRIKSFVCDQSNLSSLNDAARCIGGNFDLIVDDGSHRPIDQIVTARAFAPLLSPQGLYIIEDVQSNFALWIHNLPGEPEVIDLHIEVVDDDRLIVIRGKDV